jgi:putative spermidine/putrescine transport system substrate-binding protein
MNMNRRDLLSASAMTALAALSDGLPKLAWAADGVTVATWGGDNATVLRNGIDPLIYKESGIRVVQDISGPTQRRMKMFAERSSRRGSMDVSCLADFDMYAVGRAGLLMPINEENVPRSSKVLPFLRSPFAIPTHWSAQCIVYRSDIIKTPPQSIHELWNPKYKGKVGLIDQLFTTNTAFAAIAGGGSMTNFAPAAAKLQEWRDLGTKVYPSTDSVAAGFKTGEVWFTIVGAARAYMWRKEGIPLLHSVPQEGGFVAAYQAGVPKNARNVKGGLLYLNGLLEPESATAWASKMGYLPTVSDAQLPPELDKEINFTQAEKDRMLKTDLAYLQENQANILDVWSKTFRA